MWRRPGAEKQDGFSSAGLPEECFEFVVGPREYDVEERRGVTEKWTQRKSK
jgi:hypothetical protein